MVVGGRHPAVQIHQVGGGSRPAIALGASHGTDLPLTALLLPSVTGLIHPLTIISFLLV